MHILLVEDDPKMSELVLRGLREESHEVRLARDGRVAIRLCEEISFQLILLDVMLPNLSGFEVARQVRRRNERISVLMLTARDAPSDIVRGLDSGADDYLTKPFSFEELLARIRALERRSATKPMNVLEVEDLVLDTSSFRTFRSGRELDLSLTEFRLLELLARNQGRIVSRQMIQQTLWGRRREILPNTLDAFIRLLRKKVEGAAQTPLIHTHRGFGYSIGDSH